MDFIKLLGPRLVDPSACSSDLLKMFRFNEVKQQVEAVLRSRQAYLSSQTIFKATDDGYYHASTAVLPGERARGSGAFRGRGRGFGGRSVRSVCSPSNSTRPLLEASAASTPKVVEMDNSIFAEEFPSIAAAGTDGDTSGALEGSSREVTTNSHLSDKSLQSVLTHRGGSPSRDMCGDLIDVTTATPLVRVDGTSSKVTVSNSPSVADMSSPTESRTAAYTMATMTTQPSESSVEGGEVKKPSSTKKKFRKLFKFLRSYLPVPSSSISSRRRRQQKSGCKDTLSAKADAPPFNATNAAAAANRPHYILQNPLLSRRSGSMMIYQQKRESLHNVPLPYGNSILEDPAIDIMIDPVVDQIDIAIDPVDQIDIAIDPVVDQIDIMKDPVVDQIDIMKDPAVDQIDIAIDPVDQIDIAKDPAVDQIDIAIDPVVDQINTMVDPVDQIETMVDPEMGLGMDVGSSTGLQVSEGLQSYALNDIKQDGAYDPSIEQPGIEKSDPTMIGFPEEAREGAIEGERAWEAVASMEGPLVTLQHEDPLVTLQHEVSLVCISDPKSDTGKVTDIIDGVEAPRIIICEGEDEDDAVRIGPESVVRTSSQLPSYDTHSSSPSSSRENKTLSSTSTSFLKGMLKKMMMKLKKKKGDSSRSEGGRSIPTIITTTRDDQLDDCQSDEGAGLRDDDVRSTSILPEYLLVDDDRFALDLNEELSLDFSTLREDNSIVDSISRVGSINIINDKSFALNLDDIIINDQEPLFDPEAVGPMGAVPAADTATSRESGSKGQSSHRLTQFLHRFASGRGSSSEEAMKGVASAQDLTTTTTTAAAVMESEAADLQQDSDSVSSAAVTSVTNSTVKRRSLFKKFFNIMQRRSAVSFNSNILSFDLNEIGFDGIEGGGGFKDQWVDSRDHEGIQAVPKDDEEVNYRDEDGGIGPDEDDGSNGDERFAVNLHAPNSIVDNPDHLDDNIEDIIPAHLSSDEESSYESCWLEVDHPERIAYYAVSGIRGKKFTAQQALLLTALPHCQLIAITRDASTGEMTRSGIIRMTAAGEVYESCSSLSAERLGRHPTREYVPSVYITPTHMATQRRSVLPSRPLDRSLADSGTQCFLVLRAKKIQSISELDLPSLFPSVLEIDLGLNELHGSIIVKDGSTCFPSRLMKLDLSHNRITGVEGIAACVHLEELSLSHNLIDVMHPLPVGLLRLDLSYNLIWSKNCLRVLPLSVRLQSINMDHNPVTLLCPQWKDTLHSLIGSLRYFDGRKINPGPVTAMNAKKTATTPPRPSRSSRQPQQPQPIVGSPSTSGRDIVEKQQQQQQQQQQQLVHTVSPKEQRRKDEARSERYLAMLEGMRELRLQHENEQTRDAMPYRLSVPEQKLQDLTDRLSVPKRVSPKKKTSGVKSTFSSAHRQLLPPANLLSPGESPSPVKVKGTHHAEQTRPMSLEAATAALIQWIEDAKIILNQCVALMSKVEALPDKLRRVGITESHAEKFAFEHSQIWFGRCEPLPHRVKAAIECLSSSSASSPDLRVYCSRLEADTVLQLRQRLQAYMLQFQQIHHFMVLSIRQRGATATAGVSFRMALDAIVEAVEEQSMSRIHSGDISSLDRNNSYFFSDPSCSNAAATTDMSEISIGSDDMDSFLLRHSSADDACLGGWKQEERS